MIGVVGDDWAADVLRGPIEDSGGPEHAVAAAAASPIIGDGDAQSLVRRQGPAVTAQADDALALKPGEVDLVSHALGQVVIEADDAVIERAVRAGRVCRSQLWVALRSTRTIPDADIWKIVAYLKSASQCEQ